MAETIRYDTSDDPVAAQAIAEKEAESLRIGEDLMAKQEKRLAGKYKTAEELEAGYLELQKRLGETPATETESTEPQPEYELYSDDGAVNYDTANELYGEQLGNLFKSNDIDPFAMSKYFEENNGTLDDTMYEQLNKAGLNKDIVDNYLAGVRNSLGTEPNSTQPILTDAEVKDLKGLAGGEQGYDNLMDWAANNLGEQAAKDYDDVLATGNKSAVKFAITALMGKYEDANGRDTNLITGKESAPETYRSMAEVVRDMNKPEYTQDEAFRDDVIRKLSASNLKV
ncbi:MAG: hypothetical protein CL761_03385 [Chloroflexi bacterium]|nr:hypothetical protein [Chloroflexota bacterium]|tara:strand:+ start:2288 stop:3139 length:852 start_codon:yes stop_codon:yes gene_type:complete